MLNKLSLIVLLLALVDISRSSEVNKSIQESEDIFHNNEISTKMLLPSVKHLLKDNSDENYQAFLSLIDALQVDGYEIVDG